MGESGVASPEHDATELLAHVLGTSRGRLPLVDRVSATDRERYTALVARRAGLRLSRPVGCARRSAAQRVSRQALAANGPCVATTPRSSRSMRWASTFRAAAPCSAGSTPA